MAGRSIFAAVAAAAVCFGWGASFRAVEKVLYSWGVMVRKKLPLGAEFSGRGGIWGGGEDLTGVSGATGAAVSPAGVRNRISGRSVWVFSAPNTP